QVEQERISYLWQLQHARGVREALVRHEQVLHEGLVRRSIQQEAEGAEQGRGGHLAHGAKQPQGVGGGGRGGRGGGRRGGVHIMGGRGRCSCLGRCRRVATGSSPNGGRS